MGQKQLRRGRLRSSEYPLPSSSLPPDTDPDLPFENSVGERGSPTKAPPHLLYYPSVPTSFFRSLVRSELSFATKLLS